MEKYEQKVVPKPNINFTYTSDIYDIDNDLNLQ